jgi:hypothetical protein
VAEEMGENIEEDQRNHYRLGVYWLSNLVIEPAQEPEQPESSEQPTAPSEPSPAE